MLDHKLIKKLKQINITYGSNSNLTGIHVCLLLYVIATPKVISVQVLTCERVHSWRFYSVPPVVDQATRTMIWYPTQSHYPDTESTSPCPILIIASIWQGSDEVSVLKSLVIDQGSNPRGSFSHPAWYTLVPVWLINKTWWLNSTGRCVKCNQTTNGRALEQYWRCL